MVYLNAMKTIPKKLGICPIEESVFEIRFSTDFPSDAVFGIIFSSVKEFFSKNALQQLPIQQIPEQIRMQDPNLKYQAVHKLVKDNLSLSIGPRTIIFGNNREYIGWTNWSAFFNSILDEIENTEILSNVERIGLRYINIFNKNILRNTKIELCLNETQLLDETSNLRTELMDSGFIKILQIGNSVNIVSNNIQKKGSIIDIDCIYNFKNEKFFDSYSELVNIAHNMEKDLFFNLLNDDFIDEMEPLY